MNRFTLLTLASLTLAACSSPEPAPEAVAESYHDTGNCAMIFTADDLQQREAKHNEPGVSMVELSNGYSVFTQKFGESDDVKVLVLHGGPAMPTSTC